MPTVNIPDYHKKLSSSAPKRITRYQRGTLESGPKKHSVIIPPLNTQINFTALPKYTSRGKGLTAAAKLPTEFSWRPTGNGYTNPDDSENFSYMLVPSTAHNNLSNENGYYGMDAQQRRLHNPAHHIDAGVHHRRRGYMGVQRRKRGEFYETNRTEARKYISPVRNQAMCGSCWAVSSASAVGDVFAVAGKLPTDSSGNPVAPDPSATYVLGCYPQEQCGGGNPATLLQKIASSGIASQHCSDYSWCLNDPNCSGAATGHFKSEESMTEAFNALIPSCGCYDDTSAGHVKFFIDSVETLSLDATNDFTNTLKSHIYTHGTVIGGFLVYDNFMGGNFKSSDNPEGVYFENVNYSGTGDYFLTSDPNFDGAHAVAIIGWGVAKNTKYKYTDPNSGKQQAGVGDVPYWYVRNSWTDSWGDGGYFKIAMWPYNQKSQFDKVVTVKTSSGDVQTGGVVAFVAKAVQSGQDLGQAANVPKKLLKSSSYYSAELGDDNSGGGSGGGGNGGGGNGGGGNGGGGDDDTSSTGMKPWMWWAIGGVGFVFLALLIWFIVHKVEYKGTSGP
jgi:uncharacterized membrane protein YgcG